MFETCVVVFGLLVSELLYYAKQFFVVFDVTFQ